jgi:hypothetical protein
MIAARDDDAILDDQQTVRFVAHCIGMMLRVARY